MHLWMVKRIKHYVCASMCFFFCMRVLTSHSCTLSGWRQWATHERSTLASLASAPQGTLTSWWIAQPKRWKATLCNSPEWYWWNLLKSRIAPVSENMASALMADVISQLLAQSEQVPPRLSESQRDAFPATRSCSIKHGELFEAPCLRRCSCDPAASARVSKGLLGKKSKAQSAHA